MLLAKPAFGWLRPLKVFSCSRGAHVGEVECEGETKFSRKACCGGRAVYDGVVTMGMPANWQEERNGIACLSGCVVHLSLASGILLKGC